MKTIYIIKGETGKGWGLTWWNVYAFLDKEKAKLYLKHAQTLFMLIQKHIIM